MDEQIIIYFFYLLIKEKKIFVRSAKSKLKNLNVFNAFFIRKIPRKILQLILLILQHIFAVTVVVNKSKTHLHRKWIQKNEGILHLIILFNDLMIITIISCTLDGMMCKTTRNSYIRFIFLTLSPIISDKHTTKINTWTNDCINNKIKPKNKRNAKNTLVVVSCWRGTNPFHTYRLNVFMKSWTGAKWKNSKNIGFRM